jgi:hypothetical protein
VPQLMVTLLGGVTDTVMLALRVTVMVPALGDDADPYMPVPVTAPAGLSVMVPLGTGMTEPNAIGDAAALAAWEIVMVTPMVTVEDAWAWA